MDHLLRETISRRVDCPDTVPAGCAMDEREAVAPSPSNRQVEERETQDAQRAIAQGEATPHGVRSTALLVLSILAVVYTLSLGKEVILPIVEVSPNVGDDGRGQAATA